MFGLFEMLCFFMVHFQEKESVNTHLAGQAACIALGLMFFRTNNESIAKRIALPNSIVQLEGIKPDLVRFLPPK